jgi:DNA-binding transcriptional MerR regulator
MTKHENRSDFGPEATGRNAESVPNASHYNTLLSLENTATMFGVPRLLLRYFEWRGLIARRLRVGRTRAYGWADCERLAFILKCRQAGVALRDIVTIIESAEDGVDLEIRKIGQERAMVLVDRLEQRRKVVDEALAELGHIYALLTTRILDHDDAARRG